MNMMALTHPNAICLNARFASRDEAIRELAQRLAALGKISDTDTYLQEVFQREAIGPTALGEGLAVPHGKSVAVKEAAFAVATLAEPLQWEGVDGPESVNLIFLLAIPPSEAGSTHIEILTQLTSALVDDEVRAAVMAASTPQALLSALSQTTPAKDVSAIDDAPLIGRLYWSFQCV